MNGKVLITGASGFIGSFLVEEALRSGYDVYAGVRKTSSKQFLADERIRFLELDFSSPSTLQKQISGIGFEYVIHNAGLTYAPLKADFEIVNCQYTRHLTQAIQSCGMPLKKFVLISSLAVFGPGDPVQFRPIRETDPPRPLSSYAKSKLAAEESVRSLTSFPWLIINPTAVYGPRDQDFLKLVRLINQGFDITMGTNRQMTSLIYVEDLSRAVILAMGSPLVHRSLLLSDNGQYDKTALGIVIAAALNKKPFKIKLPTAPLRAVIFLLDKVYSLAGRQPFLNSEKFNEINSPNWLCASDDTWRALDATPQFSFERGIESTVRWYREKGWL